MIGGRLLSQRLVLLTIFAGFLPTQVAAEDAPPPSIDGSAAWQTLIGNTIIVTSKAGSYMEYFEPDGTIRHVDQDGKAVGRWTFGDGKVCLDFPDEDDRTCVTPHVSGTTGTFADQDGGTDQFEILPGNPKGL
ncbi:hypothetical protein [Lichenifustis flavocetrariae]|uniref:Uncharacterized protein n=1 Tax=Lichenifustis flavocetrariae TaxID=2949735 RepID=A0AA41Z4H8_9HYPH|nr:hypothetical protein [Lichenifustis flavocetrariae]MCW6509102.1 hypothetical protein [Lichenifustis flavocetrariae]